MTTGQDKKLDELYDIFLTLRGVFLGLCNRHDSLLSKVVVFEDGYRNYGMGPKYEQGNDFISMRSGKLRDPLIRTLKSGENEEIKKDNPKARFEYNSAGEEIYYIEPMILTTSFLKGDNNSRNEFDKTSEDAGFCLVNLLNIIQYQLNLPKLVPFSYFTEKDVTDGATGRPLGLGGRWTLFLHVLGWQNNSISPLRATRYLWDDENRRYLGDPEQIHKHFAETKFKEIFSKIPYPPHYFASDLFQNISLASVYAIDLIISGEYNAPHISLESFRKQLDEMKPGTEASTKFHNLVIEILELLFTPSLKYVQKEVRIDRGSGRVDIVFNNCSEQGYFSDLEIHHRIKCPFIFFECKNYSEDIENDEFSQMLSRLDEKKTQVGFIICRKIKDKKAIQEKCSNHYQNKSLHIMVLDDNDLLTMLEFKAHANVEAIDEYLKTKFNQIVLNQ